MTFKSIISCKTQALCELNLCWQHMIDSVLQMGQISVLCLNLSYDYLHTDLATDNPKMLMWVNAHTYALHICEHPLLYALLEEKIHLYTRILFFIHGEYRMQSYAARNRSRGFKCQLVKNGKLILNGYIFKRAEHDRDLYLIIDPSPFSRSALVSSKSEAPFTWRPSLTMLLWDTCLSHSPRPLDTNSQ